MQTLIWVKWGYIPSQWSSGTNVHVSLKGPSWCLYAFMALLGCVVEGCVCLLWSLCAVVIAPLCEFPQCSIWFYPREFLTLYLDTINTCALVILLCRLESSGGLRSCYSYFCGFTWHLVGAWRILVGYRITVHRLCQCFLCILKSEWGI